MREEPAAQRAVVMLAPRRAAEARSKAALNEPSPSSRGGGGPRVRGKLIERLATGDAEERSCDQRKGERKKKFGAGFALR